MPEEQRTKYVVKLADGSYLDCQLIPTQDKQRACQFEFMTTANTVAIVVLKLELDAFSVEPI